MDIQRYLAGEPVLAGPPGVGYRVGKFLKRNRGGVIAAYVWDYADGMQFLRHFWDVATELDRDAIPLDEGRSRFPLSRPAPLSALFESAGLADVETTALEVERTFASFDDYWQPFLGGQGPAGAVPRG